MIVEKSDLIKQIRNHREPTQSSDWKSDAKDKRETSWGVRRKVAFSTISTTRTNYPVGLKPTIFSLKVRRHT